MRTGFVQPPVLFVNGKTTIYQKFYKPLHPNPNDLLDRVFPVRFYAVRVDDLSRMVVRTPWWSGRLIQPTTWWQVLQHWFRQPLNVFREWSEEKA